MIISTSSRFCHENIINAQRIDESPSKQEVNPRHELQPPTASIMDAQVSDTKRAASIFNEEMKEKHVKSLKL